MSERQGSANEAPESMLENSANVEKSVVRDLVAGRYSVRCVEIARPEWMEDHRLSQQAEEQCLAEALRGVVSIAVQDIPGFLRAA